MKKQAFLFDFFSEEKEALFTRSDKYTFRVICKCQICIFGGLEEKLDDFEDLCTIKRQTLEEINEE